MRLAGRPQSLFSLSLLAFAFVSASWADAQAQKLRVAYTAFAGTFTILWVGKDAGSVSKARRRHGAALHRLEHDERSKRCSPAMSISFTRPPARWSTPISPAPT